MAGFDAAILTAGASLVVAIITALFTRRNQRDLERFKAEQQGLLTEKSALISYKFEARKRLYTECEPIFFQLAEAADVALRQCRRIVTPTGCKELIPSRANVDSASGSWMLNCSSELIATFYAVFAPLALFHLLREKLTTVDLSLDHGVWFRYRLARELYESIQDDQSLADCTPALPYDPVVPGWRKKRLELPRRYWWQGLTRGRLDRAVQKLIVPDANTRRVVTFGEFEDLYRSIYRGDDPNEQKILGIAANAMYGFTPFDRPVFWRLIMVHVHLHNALCRPIPVDTEKLARSPSDLRSYLRLDDYTPYDWTAHTWKERWAACPEAKDRDDAPSVALEYLVSRLSTPSGHSNRSAP
jgi:hypothetical protein